MSSRILTDSDRRYLDRILIEGRELFGPFVKVDRIDAEMNDEVALRVAYRIGQARGVSEGRGRDLLTAHSSLRSHLTRDWIDVAAKTSERTWSPKIAWLVLALVAWTLAMAAVLIGPLVIAFA
jgi:hypothetical protein